MVRSRSLAALLAAMMVFVSFAVNAGDATKSELDDLKAQVRQLQNEINRGRTGPATASRVDAAMNKYGPESAVTTRQGKLVIGGLLQVWYTSYWNDNRGLFDDPAVNGIPDTNETQDNDSFGIRRAEIRFTMDIHENVRAVVMIDPAAEAASFPGVPTNQGARGNPFKRLPQVAPEFDIANGPFATGGSVANVQVGGGAVPRLLQDAYILYHGVIPHHEMQIGQFKPGVGEEGIRNSAELDFVERSMIGQVNDQRDLGASIHGGWWKTDETLENARFQYWLGIFNGAGNYYLSAGVPRNRSDDNDEKDFNYRVLIRPLWENECWGTLELGASGMFGTHGEAGGLDPVAAPINGLDRRQTWAMKHDFWAFYAPGSIARGAWIRGEYMWMKDRNAPDSVLDLTGAGSDIGFLQTAQTPFSSSGWYVAGGYRISKSVFCDKAPAWLKPFEFAVRYETFQNVQVASTANPTETQTLKTSVFTGGINYYIKGNNAKIQLNYNAVRDPDQNGVDRRLHEVKNNNIVANFQVAF